MRVRRLTHTPTVVSISFFACAHGAAARPLFDVMAAADLRFCRSVSTVRQPFCLCLEITMISEPSCAATQWDAARRPVLQLFPCPGCQGHAALRQGDERTLSRTPCFMGQWVVWSWLYKLCRLRNCSLRLHKARAPNLHLFHVFRLTTDHHNQSEFKRFEFYRLICCRFMLFSRCLSSKNWSVWLELQIGRLSGTWMLTQSENNIISVVMAPAFKTNLHCVESESAA